MKDLLQFTDRGMYSPPTGVYIDPRRPVDKALITHGHSDHSRQGHGVYCCAERSVPILRHRLGRDIRVESYPYGERFRLGDATVSFHPAGHVIGSAQVRIEYGGRVAVVTGDYKLVDDGLCTPFEPVPCDEIVTECTFGLPVYQWPEQETLYREINNWWRECREHEIIPVLGAYSLGKAQRILKHLDTNIGHIFTHGAIEKMTEVFRGNGYDLPETKRVDSGTNRKAVLGGFVLATPSALRTSWMKRFGEVSTALASGWMALRGMRRRRNVDRGFPLSDHADWKGLNRVIEQSGAERVYVTHGYTEIFSRWLREQGYDAVAYRVPPKIKI